MRDVRACGVAGGGLRALCKKCACLRRLRRLMWPEKCVRARHSLARGATKHECTLSTSDRQIDCSFQFASARLPHTHNPTQEGSRARACAISAGWRQGCVDRRHAAKRARRIDFSSGDSTILRGAGRRRRAREPLARGATRVRERVEPHGRAHECFSSAPTHAHARHNTRRHTGLHTSLVAAAATQTCIVALATAWRAGSEQLRRFSFLATHSRPRSTSAPSRTARPNRGRGAIGVYRTASRASSQPCAAA